MLSVELSWCGWFVPESDGLEKLPQAMRWAIRYDGSRWFTVRAKQQQARLEEKVEQQQQRKGMMGKTLVSELKESI